MVRNLFSVAIMIPYIFKEYKALLKPKRPFINIVRSINGFVSMSIWFYAISLIPLSEAVSISFIVPILTTFAAIIFLQEKILTKNWLSLLIGFIGILIIIRPGFRQLNVAHLFVLMAACCWALSNVLTKILSNVQKPGHLVVYLSVIMLIISVPFAFPYFKPIDSKSLFLMFLVGLLSNISYYFTSLCYSKTNLSVIQPVDFSRLIFATIIGYYFFNEKIDIFVIIGSLIILFGIIILVSNYKTRPKINERNF